MYLQAVEISGFKTFPDKTVLTAERGITAVVGPNGSGKSNISDAICWVLGEQNPRVLRCDRKMEEVIFHGTAGRGPLHFAEASLILLDEENGDAELRITRRLFRSGESEYYINKNAVRLKDISELLMDTGLGRDGYSVIRQGHIGKIISDKSGDRRRVFEEACGISKYRHRKEEAERKLESAEENLTRTGDKISELEMQVAPLRAQSETARKFLLLRDELRTLEVAVWLDKLDKLKQDNQLIRAEYDEITAKLYDGTERLNALYEQIEGMSDENTGLNIKAEQEREVLRSLEHSASEHEAGIKVIEAQRINLEENIARLRAELSLSDEREQSLESGLSEREEQLSNAEQALLENQNKINALMEELTALSTSSGETDGKLAQLLENEEQEKSRASARASDISSLAATAEELLSQKQALLLDEHNAKHIYDKSKTELDDTKKALLHAEEQLHELQNVVSGYAVLLNSREQKAAKLRERHQKETLALGALTQRHDMLSDMEREHEGFSRAVKLVLSPSGGLSGIHGTIADLMTVPDEYTTALETALGAALQNIVVSAEEDARAAINLLKNKDGGRATFLPLSSVRGRRLEEKDLENEQGFLGLASDLLQTDGKYNEVFSSLLGRTAVVTDLDAGISLARKRGYRFRIVTLDGQILNAGGAITGGSLSRQSGILSRKNELTSLSGKIETAKTTLASLTQDTQNAERELSAVKFDLEVAQDERRGAETQAAALRTDAVHREAALAEMTSRGSLLLSQLEVIDRRIADGEARVHALKKQLAEHEQRAAALRSEHQEYIAANETLAKQSEDVSNRLAILREENAALQGQYTADKKSVEDFTKLKNERAGDRALKLASIMEYEEKCTGLLDNIATETAVLDELREKCETQQCLLSDVYVAVQELEGRRRESDHNARVLNEENTRYERDKARLESRRAAAENEEKQIIDRLWENYGLTHSVAVAERAEQMNIQKATRRIAELKKEISSLGDVNVGAIDEFERVNSRYEYLTTQRDDSANAKKELERIIADITESMRKIFAEQFKLIDGHFSQTFKEIFGGGNAALELDDPADVLTCDIRIKAQPPGKKLESISLLSGGEMSLVAIALYFAIFKVRPAPFCVLDEIDHDLDDVNVARFARYLKKLSDIAQFLVVTHRRGTMESADVLYGVTAQEEGVSKIISLKLSDVEKTIGVTN